MYQDLQGRVPLILDGGICAVGLESTVLDLTVEPPTVVRPGGITVEMLLTVLPQVQVADSVMRPLRKDEKAVSPGMTRQPSTRIATGWRSAGWMGLSASGRT